MIQGSYIMRLLKSTKNTVQKSNKATPSLTHRTSIGIDISQHAIKMVQLSGRSLNQIQLEKYVITKLPKNVVKGNKIQDYDQLATYLQHAYTQLHTPCKNFISAIPQSLVTIEHITYNPKETDLDIEEFAESEVLQISPIEEVNYDYHAHKTTSTGQQLLLLAAGKKDELEPRIEMFDNAKLSLSAMDVDLFAQGNAFSFWINHYSPELTNEKIAIFGIYATQMYALVMQNGQILYKQETPVSTEQLNQLIQRTYQVTEDKAAQMMNATTKPSDYQAVISDHFNVQVSQEVQRVLQFYYTTQSNDGFSNIKHIFLTGTASQQIGLAESVFSQTNTATQCIHPVLYATRNSNIDLPQLQIDAPSLTLAFGLALRGLII